MKEKMNQMFKDKLFLVMLVLGLLTIVAAAGVVTMRNGSGQQKNPYVDMQGQGEFLADGSAEQEPIAGESNAQEAVPQNTEEKLAGNTEQEYAENAQGNPDTVISEDGYPAAGGTAGGKTTGGTAGKTAGGEAAGRTASGETAAGGAAGERIAAEADGSDAAREANSGLQAATALALNFNEADKMLWPVRGNIVLDYSMDSTIYFPTLDQYKCNPALVIQGAESDPVCAPANARVLEAGSNEEIGNYLTLDFGNGYTAICGQLKSVEAVAGEYLQQGQVIGYVAAPTKYYSVEGSNLYFELQHEGKAVDPLDYME